MPSPLCGQRREESKKGQTQSNGVFKAIEHPPFEVGFLEAEPESEAGRMGGSLGKELVSAGRHDPEREVHLEFWPKAGGVSPVSPPEPQPHPRGGCKLMAHPIQRQVPSQASADTLGRPRGPAASSSVSPSPRTCFSKIPLVTALGETRRSVRMNEADAPKAYTSVVLRWG